MESQPNSTSLPQGYTMKEALVVGDTGEGFSFYELDDAFNEAADLARSMGLMDEEWRVGHIYVKELPAVSTEQPKDSLPEPMQCSGCGTVLRREDAHIWSIKAYCNDACAAKPDFIESHIKQSNDLPTNNRDAEKGADASVTPEYPSAIPAQRTSLPAEVGTSGDKDTTEHVAQMISNVQAAFDIVIQDRCCGPEEINEAVNECDEVVAALRRISQALRLPHEVNALIDEALTFSHQDCGHRDQDGYGCIRCAAENADMRRRSNDNFQAFAQANGRTRDRDDAADLLSMADRMSYLCAKFEIPNSHEFEGMARGIRDLVEAWRTDR
jgi:hypothetical protein